MSVQSIIVSLGGRGIQLIPDGDGLIVEPASKLADADRALISRHKAEILAVLAKPERATAGQTLTGRRCRSAVAARWSARHAMSIAHPATSPIARSRASSRAARTGFG